MTITEAAPTDGADTISARAYDLGRKEGRIAEARSINSREGAKTASFTAAARVIDLHSESEQARIKKLSGASGVERWQNEAWGYYDALGELKYGARFKGRSLSKVRLVPAIQLGPDSNPIPLADLENLREENASIPVVGADTIRQCEDAMTRLAAGQGHGGLLNRWGENGFVVGEGYLVGYRDDTSTTGETFIMASTDELRVDDRGRWCLVGDPDEKPGDWVRLDDNSIMVRIWNRHARYANLADSSVRGVLDVCEQLLLLSNEQLGAGMSRMNNGIVIFPNTMVKNRRAPEGDATDGEAQRDPVIEDIQNHIITPIGNPRSAAAAAPFIMTGDPDDVDKVKHLKFDRAFDKIADERIDKLIIRMANGVDLPAAILTGLADVNHWTGWLIDDMTFRAHIQPDTIEFCGALTSGYYQPLLLAGGVDPALVRQLVIWYDATDLVGDPDEQDRAFKAVEMGLLGDSPARRRLGYGEEERPTEEDIARRVILKGRVQEQVNAADLPAGVTESEPAAIAPGSTTPTVEGEGAPGAVAAAGTPSRRRLDALSRSWAKKDQALRNRLLAQADAAMLRTLDRAGARLRTKAIKASAAHADLVGHAANRDVAALLGPGVVTASLGISTEELLDGSFDDLVARFRAQTARVQATILADLEDLGLDEEASALLAARQAEDRDRGATALSLAMVGLATSRLFSPSPNAPPVGEHDTNLTVPFGLLRSALSTAGGATGTPTAGGAFRSPIDDSISGEVAMGDSTVEALDALGYSIPAWSWETGAPTRPFEPHQALDGTEFSDWDADELINDEGWPDFTHYFPGDHDGCECYAVALIEGPPEPEA